MSPMLATEGESAKHATHAACRQSVKSVGTGAQASNDQKPAIRGVVSGGPIPLPTAQPFEPKTLVEYDTNSMCSKDQVNLYLIKYLGRLTLSRHQPKVTIFGRVEHRNS